MVSRDRFWQRRSETIQPSNSHFGELSVRPENCCIQPEKTLQDAIKLPAIYRQAESRGRKLEFLMIFIHTP
jgi:hypothetical protein